MSLFKSKKNKEQAPACCCAQGNMSEADDKTVCCGEAKGGVCCGEAQDGICCVKVMGLGCKACHEQLENVKKAVSALGLDVEVEYVTDMEKIMTYGVMSMPGLVVNEKVVSAGKVLKPADAEKLLRTFIS